MSNGEGGDGAAALDELDNESPNGSPPAPAFQSSSFFAGSGARPPLSHRLLGRTLTGYQQQPLSQGGAGMYRLSSYFHQPDLSPTRRVPLQSYYSLPSANQARFPIHDNFLGQCAPTENEEAGRKRFLESFSSAENRTLLQLAQKHGQPEPTPSLEQVFHAPLSSQMLQDVGMRTHSISTGSSAKDQPLLSSVATSAGRSLVNSTVAEGTQALVAKVAADIARLPESLRMLTDYSSDTPPAYTQSSQAPRFDAHDRPPLSNSQIHVDQERRIRSHGDAADVTDETLAAETFVNAASFFSPDSTGPSRKRASISTTKQAVVKTPKRASGDTFSGQSMRLSSGVMASHLITEFFKTTPTPTIPGRMVATGRRSLPVTPRLLKFRGESMSPESSPRRLGKRYRLSSEGGEPVLTMSSTGKWSSSSLASRFNSPRSRRKVKRLSEAQSSLSAARKRRARQRCTSESSFVGGSPKLPEGGWAAPVGLAGGLSGEPLLELGPSPSLPKVVAAADNSSVSPCTAMMRNQLQQIADQGSLSNFINATNLCFTDDAIFGLPKGDIQVVRAQFEDDKGRKLDCYSYKHLASLTPTQLLQLTIRLLHGYTTALDRNAQLIEEKFFDNLNTCRSDSGGSSSTMVSGSSDGNVNDIIFKAQEMPQHFSVRTLPITADQRSHRNVKVLTAGDAPFVQSQPDFIVPFDVGVAERQLLAHLKSKL